MNAVFNMDARSGGSLMRSMNSGNEQGGAVQNSMRHFASIARMFGGRAPGTSGSMQQPGAFPGGHSHAPGHDKGNCPHCSVDHGKANAVTSGSSESMDR